LETHGAGLVSCDDLLNDVYSRNVCELFTRGSHHRNTSVVIITQNLYHQGRHCRDISLNAKYLVLLKYSSDKNQFTYLARQVYPEHSQSLYKAYLNATKRPHGYIILDFGQNTNDMLRFRTNIFPDEHPPITYASVFTSASKTTCKISGLTLNFSATQVVNFEKKNEVHDFKQRQRTDHHYAYRKADKAQAMRGWRPHNHRTGRQNLQGLVFKA
jgi:hypothetical protein